jgi:hypothetical protein
LRQAQIIITVSVEVRMIFLVVIGYLVASVALVWGWVRFGKHEKPRALLPVLTLGGFLLATASALLAFGSVSYAHFHYFRFYDPVLLKIFRTGLLLSFGAVLLSLTGVWRPSSLRWHAPISAFATTAFWILAADGE